jgi:hypothetical protein
MSALRNTARNMSYEESIQYLDQQYERRSADLKLAPPPIGGRPKKNPIRPCIMPGCDRLNHSYGLCNNCFSALIQRNTLLKPDFGNITNHEKAIIVGDLIQAADMAGVSLNELIAAGMMEILIRAGIRKREIGTSFGNLINT